MFPARRDGRTPPGSESRAAAQRAQEQARPRAGGNAHPRILWMPWPVNRKPPGRRRCLERLLIEVDRAEVAMVSIESRSPEQDHLDRGLLTGLRMARVLPKSLTVTW